MDESFEGIEKSETHSRSIPDVLAVEKQALIAAILELERQDEIQSFLILSYIDRIEALLSQLKKTAKAERPFCAKHKLHQLFLPNSEWINILTDDRIHAWQAEAKILLNDLDKG